MGDENQARVWLRMAREPVIADSLRALAHKVAAEVARVRPRCDVSGRCCNFEAYGHRMYLTGLEVAYAVTLHREAPPPPHDGVESGSSGTGIPPVCSTSGTGVPPVRSASTPLPLLQPPTPPVAARLSRASLADAIARGGCPFQVGLRCGIHAIRPLPCRVYFCDPAAQAWQHDLTERLLRHIRALHDDHAIPYAYAEWRSLLAEVLDAEA